MRAESTIRPAVPFEIEYDGEFAVVKFFTDVIKKEPSEHDEDDTAEKFTYNEYSLRVRSRPNLADSIENNHDAWLQLAIEKESEPAPETDAEKILRLEAENSELLLNQVMLEATIDGLQDENAFILLELAKGV